MERFDSGVEGTACTPQIQLYLPTAKCSQFLEAYKISINAMDYFRTANGDEQSDVGFILGKAAFVCIDSL